MAAAATLRLRTRERRRTRLLLQCVALAMISSGCGREERTQTELTPALERASVTGDSTSLLAPTVATVRDTSAADTSSAATTSLGLAGLGRSRLAGEVALMRTGSATRVVTRLNGAAAGQTYSGMIRRGTCAQLGSRVASLVPATADSLGLASSISDVPVPLRTLRAAPHIIVFGKDNRPATCGTI